MQDWCGEIPAGVPVQLVGRPVQFVSAGSGPVIVTTTPNPSSARRGVPLLDKEGPGVVVTKWLGQPTRSLGVSRET
jgi:hypothetical protein